MYDTLAMIKPDKSFSNHELNHVLSKAAKSGPETVNRVGTGIRIELGRASLCIHRGDQPHVVVENDEIAEQFGFQAGPRRSEMASLCVKDLHTNAGYRSLQFIRNGGEELSLTLNPQTAQRFDERLTACGHGCDSHASLFRPLVAAIAEENSPPARRRHLHPESVDGILRKYAALAGLDTGYSAHSMRATFITIALDRGARLEDGACRSYDNETLRS